MASGDPSSSLSGDSEWRVVVTDAGEWRVVWRLGVASGEWPGVTSDDSEWRVERRVEKTGTRSGEWAGLTALDD